MPFAPVLCRANECRSVVGDSTQKALLYSLQDFFPFFKFDESNRKQELLIQLLESERLFLQNVFVPLLESDRYRSGRAREEMLQ
ncbi:hypothetical protein EI42_05340 [Thermosporothrix hazakensis]|jgi:hypothetical protein|uniref:Uncharacterized protein n=1 Tax=Thermosporothrix hazakensis TaxID=644383 RepID=A0A326TYY0_THEHA|nr:hypothetical protein EI42_05340 [Thermosporothrix hazakensis]